MCLCLELSLLAFLLVEKPRNSATAEYHATRCISKFVLCFMSYGSFIQVSNSKIDLQGHSRALAMVPFDRPHTISN